MLRAIIPIVSFLTSSLRQAGKTPSSDERPAGGLSDRRQLGTVVLNLMLLCSGSVLGQEKGREPAAAAAPAEVSLLDYDFWPVEEKEELSAGFCPPALRQPLRALVEAARTKPRPSLQQLKTLREAARAAAPESPVPNFAYALACEQAGYPSECATAYPALAGTDRAFFLPAWQACAMWQLEHARERDVVSWLPAAFAATLSEHQIPRLSEAQFGQTIEWIGTVTALMLETRKLDKKRRQSLEQFASEAQPHAAAGPHFTRGLERMRAAIEVARAQGLVNVSRADEKKIVSLESTLTSLEEKGKNLVEEKTKSESDRETVRQQATDQIAEVDEALNYFRTEYLQLESLLQSFDLFSRQMRIQIARLPQIGFYERSKSLNEISIQAVDPIGRPVRAIRRRIATSEGEDDVFSVEVLEGPQGQQIVKSTLEIEMNQLQQRISKLQQMGLATQQRRQAMVVLYQREMGIRLGQELKAAQWQVHTEKKAAVAREKLEKTVKASRDKQLASAETYFSWNAAEELSQLLERVKE